MTPSGPPPDASPDERRVLDELERLQLAIRETRQKSGRVEADFATQLKAFEPLSAKAPVPPAVVSPIAVPAAPVAPAPVPPPEPVPARVPATAGQPDARLPLVAAPTAVSPPAARRTTAILAVVAGTVVVIVGVGWLSGRPSDSAPPQAVQAPAAATPPPQAPSLPRPAPPVDPHPLRIDLTTLRRVWLRVTVDGRIAIEREVAAGEQLPFGADHAIVLRAGDAGAVTVRVGGIDQGVVGRDGQVVSRTFDAPVR